MREFELEIDEHLRNGLRPEASNPVNGPYLVELRNARPSHLGLMPYEATTLPYDSDQAFFVTDHVVDWPFPQVLFGKKHRFVGTRDRMYSVDALGVLTSLFNYSSNERWNIADFNEYVVTTKDGTKVMTRAITGAWGLSATMPLCKTVVNLNGQLFMGNLAAYGTWTDLSERHVAWSDIGSAVFTLDRKNEAGYREQDFSGPVVEVKKLGQAAVVYGYNGVSAYAPVTVPVATFSYKNLSSVGIFNKGAVAGDDKEHCFVGSDGYIYKIDSTFKVTQMGYQEYITQLTDGLVIVNFDASTGDYYFSDGVKSFILTPKGMAEIYQRISTLERYNGVKYGVSSDDTDSSFLAVTDRMDFGFRGRKSSECIEISAQGSGSFSAAVDWRNGPGESFQRTDWVPVNDQGVARIKVSAVEFRFAIKCTVCTDAFLSSMKVRYKMDDMKSLRGVYAPPSSWRGQYAG